MPAISKNDFCITVGILGLELTNKRIVPKWQILPNLHLHYFFGFGVIELNLFMSKLLFNIPIIVPYHLISSILVVYCPEPSCNPKLEPSCRELSYSFFSTLLLQAYNMVGSDTSMRTIWFYSFHFRFLSFLFDNSFGVSVKLCIFRHKLVQMDVLIDLSNRKGIAFMKLIDGVMELMNFFILIRLVHVIFWRGL